MGISALDGVGGEKVGYGTPEQIAETVRALMAGRIDLAGDDQAFALALCIADMADSEFRSVAGHGVPDTAPADPPIRAGTATAPDTKCPLPSPAH